MARIKGFDALGKLYGLESKEKTPQTEKKSSPKPVFKGTPSPKNSLATAPYNFVSLPERVLPAQFQDVEGFKEHVTSAETVSGEILLDIETLTPIFIGGNEPESFAPLGMPIIPGSSLRGMFKNIFKIVTCGAFRGQSVSQRKGEDFNDEHIYFRCLMGVGFYPWTKQLNKHYIDLMTDRSTGRKKALPGFLICTDDNKVFIAPAQIGGEVLKNDRKDDYLMIKEFQERYGKIGNRDSRIFWDDKIAYCLTGNQFAKKPDKLLDKEAYEKYKSQLAELHAKLEAGKLSKKEHDAEVKSLDKGKQIVRFTSLDYVDCCRDHWLEVPDEVLNSYRHDRNRKGVNLFTDGGILTRAKLERLTKKNFPDVVSLIPCHFLAKDGQVTAFGHGQCFRIPYQRRISDAVKISGNESVDFADALFGNKDLWASRIYFEDATPVNETVSELETNEVHPLMQPNPTSYQLYLKQGGKELVHWDMTGAQIRGYKLYWHKAAADWKANAFELSENNKRLADGKEPLTKKITPLAKGNRFKAKIRFKNLSKEELGALMMIFDLDGATNAAYKIGQGKPFGFGSVRITSKLFVEDETAYTKLFDTDGWQNPYDEKNPAEYLAAFTQHLKDCDRYETWRDVMDELKKILDWSPTSKARWSDSVRQMNGEPKKDFKGKETMELDERFKQRVPLPTIRTIFEAVK